MLTRYLVELEGDLIDRPGRTFILLTRSGRVLDLPTDLLRRLQSSEYPSSCTQGRLIDAGLIVQQGGDDEVDQLIDENSEAIDSSDELYFVVQPSSFCQFDCGYCGQVHSKTKMSRELSNRIVEWIESKLELRQYHVVTVGWFGGEPMAAFTQICDLGKRIKTLCASRGIAFRSKIVTNGLNATHERICSLIKACNLFKLEVTIDGPAEVHNARRSPNLKIDTYERIIQNLSSLHSISPELEIVIRCNVDRQNVHTIGELISALSRIGLQEFCRMYFAPVHSWGNHAHELGLSPKAFAYNDLAWRAQLVDNGWMTGFLPARKEITCMAVRSNSAVFEPSGKAFGCTEMPLVPSYDGQEIGSLEDSGNISKVGFYRHFLTEIRQNEVPCYSCFALPVCGGACPKEWSEGRIPCPPFKYSAPQALLMALLTEQVVAEEIVGPIQ